MKRIVFVTEKLFGGGAERVTAALMNELCKQAEVHLVSTYHHDTSEDYPTDPRVIKHTIGPSNKPWAGVILDKIAFLGRVIPKIDPFCVVSLATPRTNILLTAALLGKKIPVVLSERNDPERWPEEKLIRLLRLWTFASCSGVVFQTSSAQSFFSPRVRRKSIVICNPITGNLPPRYDGQRETRIINCSRLYEQKNLDLLIDAFSDIAEEFPDMSLEIWGEGPERARLERKVRDMKLADRVLLPGYSSNVYSVMLKSAMFVLSSDYEGISNSMLEAISLGVPTISTDCPAGGARETIQDGVNGLLVPTGDRRAMAQAMRRVITEEGLAERMSKNGCMLRDAISVDVIAQKWWDFINDSAC